MSKIIRELDGGTRFVAGVEVQITEAVWDGGGRSIEVHRVDTGDDLTTDECFDEIPSDEQIKALLDRQQPQWWTCRGCATRIAESQADLIIAHVRDCDLVDGAGSPVRGDA